MSRYDLRAPYVFTYVALGGALLMNELLRDAFDPDTEFNSLGLAAIFALTVFSVGGFASTLSARRNYPSFHGTASEVARIISFGLVCLTGAAWIAIAVNGSF